MKVAMRVFGFLFLAFGMIWMAYIVGGVASQTAGFTDLIALIPAYLFHAVSTALGVHLITKSLAKKPASEPKAPAAA